MPELAQRWQVRVVGVTFTPDYPENLSRLKDAADLRFLLNPGQFGSADRRPEPLPAVLIRRPDNQFDPNAVEVHVPEVGMIGHLPRALAVRVAPEMDATTEWAASVDEVWVHPDHPERPGITVNCWRAPRPVEDTAPL